MLEIHKSNNTILIYVGYICRDCLDCKYGKKCKYRYPNCFWHNLSVDIHRFFQYKLHINLPYLSDYIAFIKHNDCLSGTNKCPHKLPRNYTCFDCKYSIFCDECEIPYEDRKPNIENPYFSKYSRCGSFEKGKHADDYKKDKLLGGCNNRCEALYGEN